MARRKRRLQGVPVYARLLSLPELERAGVRVVGQVLRRHLPAEGVRRPETGQDYARRGLVHRVCQRPPPGR